MARIGCIMKRSSLIGVVCMTALAFLGCSFPPGSLAPEPPSESGKGALLIVLTLASLSLQTLQPSISMQIASFDIQGTGPDPLQDHFEDLGNTTGLLMLTHLSPGAWTIAVDARNAGGTVIGHGQTDPPVQILAGQVTDAQINIRPLSGTGMLELIVKWPNRAHRNAVAECSLLSMSTGADLAPAFSVNNKGATHGPEAIEAGYYLLTLRFYARGVQFWGVTEAVRIVAGQTTTQTWDIE